MARDSGWLSSQVLRQQWYSIFIPGSTPSSTPSSVAPLITYRYYVALRNIDNHPSMARKMGVFGPCSAASDCSFDGLVSITRFPFPCSNKIETHEKANIGWLPPPLPPCCIHQIDLRLESEFFFSGFLFLISTLSGRKV